MPRSILSLSAAAGALLLWASPALAATLSVSVDKTSVSVGDVVNATLRIDSGGVGINAAQATLRFPKDLLELTSVDRSASVFGFWLAGPTADNGAGTLTFTGGTANGVSGASLQVLTAAFKVKGTGTADLALTDGAVTASDGSGTNVLSSMVGAQVISVPKNQVVQAPAPPVQITRPAVPSATKPALPALNIPLYPDPTKWYNVSGPFLVRWTLPPDVTGVATAVTRSPTTEPGASEGLFDNKAFAALPEGVSYVHVQFKNNVGWGPVAHQRIGVDVDPPAPFAVTEAGGTPKDQPNPTIAYASSDAISGIAGYTVRVDNGAAVPTKDTTFPLPDLPPGTHTVLVTAMDQAGNRTESTLTFSVLPIASPVMNPIRAAVYAGESGPSVDGTAGGGATAVRLSLLNAAGASVADRTAAVSPDGSWSTVFTEGLPAGSYKVTATAADARGALSLPVAASFDVRQRPVLAIDGIGVSAVGLLGLLVLVLAAGAVAGAFWQRRLRQRRGFRALTVTRDIANAFAIARREVETAQANVGREGASRALSAALGRAHDKLAKAEKYILDNVEELNG